MSDYTQEQFEQLPEFMQKDLTKVGDVYKHAGVVKLKESLNELDGKVKTYESQTSELTNKLTEFEKNQQNAIEKAKLEALENAKSKKDVDEIERTYKEQMADLEKRTEERTREAVTKEFTVKQAQQQASMELKEIANKLKPLDDESSNLIEIAIAKRQRVDENGKIIYLNEDGSASSLDKLGLVDELIKAGKFSRLRQADVTTQGGGLANGNDKGGAQSKTMQRTQFNQLNPKAKMDFIKSGGKPID